MKTYTATEILINANRVHADNRADSYEFVFNKNLTVVECVHIKSLQVGHYYPISHFLNTLNGVLFELNHVRVNPHLDNHAMIGRLTEALADIGVDVYHTPPQDSMAMCYRPLGEITQNVRFFFNEQGKCTFLSPEAKLRTVPNNVHRVNFRR